MLHTIGIFHDLVVHDVRGPLTAVKPRLQRAVAPLWDRLHTGHSATGRTVLVV